MGKALGSGGLAGSGGGRCLKLRVVWCLELEVA